MAQIGKRLNFFLVYFLTLCVQCGPQTKTTGFLRKAESKINDMVTIPVGKEVKVD